MFCRLHAPVFVCAVALLSVCPARADDIHLRPPASESHLAEEAADRDVAASPKAPWGEFPIVEEEVPPPLWEQILLWIPNRILDFIDIFRADVGVGSSVGAVVRVTKYGQVGYRSVGPTSFRIGDFGRQEPFMLETSSEFGVGPFYVNSKNRKICTGELGVGADLFFIGAYGGICVEEVADFLAGLFLFDLKDDDLR